MNKQSGTVAGTGVLTVWLWGLSFPNIPMPPEVAVVIGVALMQPIGDIITAAKEFIVQWINARKRRYEIVSTDSNSGGR